MFRKFTGSFALVLIAFGLLASSAFAAVSFDPATGTGFVGKGDVQLAFGWNNAALQKNAPGVTFAYNTEDTYTAVCEWTTGDGTRGEKTHTLSRNRSVGVAASIAYDARVRNQITGFNLTGINGERVTTGGSVPVEGDPCPGQGTDGTWTSVALTSSIGGLYVNYGGTSVLLP